MAVGEREDGGLFVFRHFAPGEVKLALLGAKIAQ
jgi:hypothetical protein